MFAILLLFLSGCSNGGEEIQIHNNTKEDATKVEDLIKKDKRLKSAVTFFHDKEVILGVTVGTFSRFHKAKIEQELKDKLQELYPKLEVTVSADSKIIMETKKLMKLKDTKKLTKKIEELKSLLKEET